jgi:hypothetical protein
VVVELPWQLLCSGTGVGSWHELSGLADRQGDAPRSGARGQGAFSDGGVFGWCGTVRRGVNDEGFA